MKQIKSLHNIQNQNVLGRVRNDFDWKNLCELWRKACHNSYYNTDTYSNSRARYMFYLAAKDENDIARIVAYVVLHNDPGNKLAQVNYF